MTLAELIAELDSLRAQVARIGDEEAAALAELRALKAPRWTVANPHTLPSATAGVAFSHNLAQYVTAPAGGTVTYRRTGGTAPTTVTVSATGTLTATRLTRGGTFTIEVDAA